MSVLILCAIILTGTTRAVPQDYQHMRGIHGIVKAHQVIAPWEEAQRICDTEGAILASPLNTYLLNSMKHLINANHQDMYLIGTRAQSVSGQFVSIEGITIEDMPVFDMLDRLDLAKGQCLAINENRISVVPCWMSLPFMCRSKTIDCGAGYQLLSVTGSCYKFHADKKTWDEGQATCVSEGGHLAVIDDDIEATECKKLITATEVSTNIGLRRVGLGHWKSVHDTPVEQLYNEWIPKPGTNECRCGVLYTSGVLDKLNCTFPRFFLCEKAADDVKFTYRAT